jgi:hypothetical protein
MDRIPANGQRMKGRATMLKVPLGAYLFGVVLAIVTFDTSILHGQRNSEDPNYELTNINTGSPLPPSNGGFPATPSSTNDETVGKAIVNRPSGNKPNLLPRKSASIQGTEPKQLIPRSSKSATTNPAYHNVPNSKVTQASHLDTTRGLDRDGNIPKQRSINQQEMQNAASMVVSPMESNSRPPVRGTLIGLNGGQSTVERILSLQTAKTDLERENDELRQLNAGLQVRVRESQEQLLAVVKELQSARKDVSSARNDLDRLRADLQNLREKIRLAQKEHTDVLQSMGPLLQQLLESDDVGSLPPNPME